MVLHYLQGVTGLARPMACLRELGRPQRDFHFRFSSDVSYPPDCSYESHIDEHSGVALVKEPIPHRWVISSTNAIGKH